MVDGDGILAEPARRLHHQHHVARLHCGDDDLAVGIAARSTNNSPGGGPQCSLDRVGEFGGQRPEPLTVVLGGQSDRIAGQLPFGEPVGVLPAAFDQCVDQCVTVACIDTGHVADLISALAHRPQQRDGAGRSVQSDGVADAGVFGRVGREHQRYSLVGGSDMTQPRMPDRQPGHSRTAFRVGHIGDQPVVVDLLERERDRDDPAVELGHRDLGGDVQRGQAVVVAQPLFPWAGQAQALQDRDIQGRKVFDVPAVVVAAGRRRWPAWLPRRPAR